MTHILHITMLILNNKPKAYLFDLVKNIFNHKCMQNIQAQVTDKNITTSQQVKSGPGKTLEMAAPVIRHMDWSSSCTGSLSFGSITAAFLAVHQQCLHPNRLATEITATDISVYHIS